MQAISTYLAARRTHIMQAWHTASDSDPDQTTADSLTRTQFYDHIPQVLEAFEHKLAARAETGSEVGDTEEGTLEEMKHGLHRWQQGYRLREVTREWGHLHLCLSRELQHFAAAHPEVDSVTIAESQYELIKLVNHAINESLSQYVRMEKEAAAGRARDLERALAELAGLEQQRGAWIREAVHDLSGSVHVVTSAAAVLSGPPLQDEKRAVMAATIERGVKTLRVMLGELTSLARLEAGEEKRQIVHCDVAEVLQSLCSTSQSLAAEKGLTLAADGPLLLSVEGDRDKIHRIAQNLVLNALKYTAQGGVCVTWGQRGQEQWWFQVKDTGPGMDGTTHGPILEGLKAATATAKETENKGEPGEAETADQQIGNLQSRHPSAGEGIGLVIVKRLCDLLDATLEVTSSPTEGTTFRAILPVSYQTTPQAD